MLALTINLTNEQCRVLQPQLDELCDALTDQMIVGDWNGEATKLYAAMQRIAYPIREHNAKLKQLMLDERNRRLTATTKERQTELFAQEEACIQPTESE